jgi:hypothetical protein
MPYILGPPRARNPHGQIVQFQLNPALPPADRYVSPNETMELRVFNPSTDVVLNVGTRFIDTIGQLQNVSSPYTVKAPGTGTKPLSVQITECFLLGALIEVVQAIRGQCFVQLYLLRGQAKQPSILDGLLCQGYVSTVDLLGYPQARPESSISGRGWVHSVEGPDPGGASTAVVTVPDGVRWYVKNARVTVTADDFPQQTRILCQILDADGNVLHDASGFGDEGVTAPYDVAWIDGAFSSSLVDLVFPMTMSGAVLAGGSVQVIAANAGGGALSLGPLRVTVEEFVEV